MKNLKPISAQIMLALVLVSLSASAAAPSFRGKFTFKDVTAPGATETDSYAINDNGAITGDYLDSAGVQHGMILKGKTLITIDNANCTSAISFYGINAAQQLAGWCNGSSGTPIGFTYANGNFTTISPPGATSTEANGINAKGVVVGSYVDSTGATHGFVLTGKKYKTLDVPGAAGYTAAWSVNNSGVIGVYGINSAGSYVSFTTSNNGKTYKSFAYSGAGTVGTVIHAVSNKGDIDGTYFDSNGLGKGVLFHQGKFYPFQETNDCGVSPCSTRADGLNGALQIVGRYSPSDGTSHGFIAHAK